MKKKPRISLAIAAVAALAASYGIARRPPRSQPDGRAGRRILYYVDPMHPAYKSDQPGVAPDCGMPLVAVYAGDDASAGASSPQAQMSPATVSVDDVTRRLVGMRVAAVEKTGATRVIRVLGRVAPEDTRVYRINSGVAG